MNRVLGLLAAALAWSVGCTAGAQDYCADLRGLLVEAPSEFSNITGAAVPGSWPPHLAVFEATRSLPGAGPCVIAHQTHGGRRFSTSYTCSNVGADSEAGLQVLKASLRHCIDLTVWNVQPQPDGRGAQSAQYGLLRLSITRNGERGGLALGIEAFRDDRGEVMGSPTRGDSVRPDGVHRCSPKTPEEIARLIAMYGERPGAERFEVEQFIGYTNRTTRPVVAFVTRPVHPAHPAIIVRDVFERDGSNYVTAGGDFAGDCEAFHALLQEVQEMNRNLRPQ